MQASIQHALIIGLMLAIAMGILAAWIMVRSAETKGYDLGYDDAKRGYNSHIEALHEDIEAKHLALRQAEAAHRLNREQLLQDCDNRIAHYSRHANPFTEQDLATLAGAMKCLTLACNTFAGLQARDIHAEAATQLTAIREMHGRLKQVLTVQDTLTPEPSSLALVESHLVHAPEACGKTRNARAIAAALGLSEILDDWQPGMPAPAFNTLILTNSNGPFTPFKHRTLSFEEAMQRVEAQRMETAA